MQKRSRNVVLMVIAVTLLLAIIFQREKQPSDTPAQPEANILDEILEKGELVVVTRNSPTAYYHDQDGPTGLEYDLTKGFADWLGVELRLIIPDNFSRIIGYVLEGDAHFAAAGLTITENRRSQVKFGPVYQEITQQLIYRRGNKRPRSLEDLAEGRLDVIAHSSHAEQLEFLSLGDANLTWTAHDDKESDELLYLVWDHAIDYTIADSNEVVLNQRFFPELKVAFDLTEPQPLAWAFPPNEDNSLYDKVVAYFEKIAESGELTQLIERHYGHVSDFDYVGTRRFRRHIDSRLVKYQSLFEEAAEQHLLDWRLLAAIGYQESHWNPKAVSPTGVRGIMMLTQRTAGQLGVKNRLDPKLSIFGGAKYFRHLKDRIDETVLEPDRTWMALAAYNVGYYHLQDARKIAEMQERDPNKWVDVKETLPLLSNRKWHKKVNYGYARGWEAVRYVDNIRGYYDILVWLDTQNAPPPETLEAELDLDDELEAEEPSPPQDAPSIMPLVM